MMKFLIAITVFAVSSVSHATLVSISPCDGPNSCTITTSPPDPVTENPNDGVLLAWDELQNFTLTEALRVDRVFDDTVDFILADGGDFLIEAGTVVSSHYLQWDPGQGSAETVTATINLDSQVFAFITADQNLFDSDYLGLPGLDYNDFTLRGLESGDETTFNGANTNISWTASSPGDWTRLITAFSPGGDEDNTAVPVPGTFVLLGLGLAGLGWKRRSS